MINLNFSEDEIKQILHDRRYHPHPYVRKKMEALYYKSLGLPHHEICSLCDIGGRATLVRYLREYQEGGLESIRTLRYHTQQSPLVMHRDTIAADFAANPPATVNEARDRISDLTGIRLSITAVNRFMKKHIG